VPLSQDLKEYAYSILDYAEKVFMELAAGVVL
jgi:hypothetical protein